MSIIYHIYLCYISYMHTITVANPKGGVGKTTIAENLAFFYEEAFDLPLAYLNMDDQGSPHQTQPIPDADYCIVDTAGKLERELSQLFTDTDTLIVPTMSSPLGMKPLHTLVTHFRKVSPQARLIVVVNCYDSRRSVDRFYLDYIRKNIDPRPYTIPESTKMVQCLMKPCSVVSAFPGSRPAIAFEELARDVFVQSIF